MTEMPNDQRHAILNNLIGQLRQQQQHQVADVFYDILGCYSNNPMLQDDRAIRLYLTWFRLFELQGNRIVRQIVNQPI